jgi:uroporphyrinogen-III decarboxylase
MIHFSIKRKNMLEHEMTPKERVMTALRRGQPDMVPWVENDIEEEIQIKVMKGRTDFTPGELCRTLGMDGFGYHFPTGGKATAGQSLQSGASMKETYYYPKKITFDFVPPWIADMGVDASSGRTYVKHGLLTSRDSLKLFDEFLPDPNHQARYDQVAKWIAQYREDYAVFARIRLGTASMFESMGLDVFSVMMFEEPDLVKEIHRRFSEWSARVVENLNKLDIDFIWANDDHADTKAPWVNTEWYEEFIQPYQMIVTKQIKKPWIFHSDGNLFPILDSLMKLGMTGLHPIQPAAMDINKVKAMYGDKVSIIGNIDLDYTLTLGTPEEVEREVKDRIEKIGKGGGYIISSANSITDYCKLENVWAMAKTIEKYRRYPAK